MSGKWINETVDTRTCSNCMHKIKKSENDVSVNPDYAVNVRNYCPICGSKNIDSPDVIGKIYNDKVEFWNTMRSIPWSKYKKEHEHEYRDRICC